MKKIKPTHYALFWVSDGGQEDWFVLVPYNDKNGKYHEWAVSCDYDSVAEEFHMSYEGFEIEYAECGFIYAGCTADYITSIPASILENTEYRDGITYLDKSIESFNKFEDRKKYCVNEFIKQLKNCNNEKINEIISKYNNNELYDKIYEIMIEINNEFEYDEFWVVDDHFIKEFCEKHNLDVSTFREGIYYGYYLNGYANSVDSGYGTIHAQNDILVQVEGMEQLDDGLESGVRRYKFGEKIFYEGKMQAEIDFFIDQMKKD